MEDLISKSTRYEFRESLVGAVLRQIDMIFDGVGLVPHPDHIPGIDGARRSRVEQYYANVDFSAQSDVEKVLAAFGEVILWLRREGKQADADGLVARMERDGYQYSNGVFVPIRQPNLPFVAILGGIAARRDLPQLLTQVDRINQSVEDDPGLAVGTAKELVETVCKTILDEKNVPIDTDDLGRLTRATAKELRLEPHQLPGETRGADTIKRLLSNLGQMPQGLAELRNLYGTGHGRSGRVGGIQPRHARLAVGAAATLAVFFLETHMEQIQTNHGSTG